MSWLVQTRLINEQFSDPGVFVDFQFGKRAILFDLGDLAPLSARELLRVTHIFVTHRHMDHFAGFDRLLRVTLYRPGVLRFVGPPGLIDGIAAKLHGYVWNLLDANSPDFAILAAEFDGDRIGPWTRFRARDAFRASDGWASDLPPGRVLSEPDLWIECVTLDHNTPCLAFCLQERLRVNVSRAALDHLGLPVGPWLNVAKSAVRGGAPDDMLIAIQERQSVRLGALKEQALRVAPGQRVAYVTDAAFNPANIKRIVRIAQNAHQLYIEAAFLEADAQLAAERCHLTARQAGTLARLAGARRLTTFHYSPRYLERPESLRLEAESAYRSHELDPVD
jgi:ribonuclease Z